MDNARHGLNSEEPSLPQQTERRLGEPPVIPSLPMHPQRTEPVEASPPAPSFTPNMLSQLLATTTATTSSTPHPMVTLTLADLRQFMLECQQQATEGPDSRVQQELPQTPAKPPQRQPEDRTAFTPLAPPYQERRPNRREPARTESTARSPGGFSGARAHPTSRHGRPGARREVQLGDPREEVAESTHEGTRPRSVQRQPYDRPRRVEAPAPG